LADGHLADAGRLAHSLKGAAGNLGARRIHALADALTTAIRQDTAPDVIERDCAALILELSRFIAALKDALAEVGTGPETPAAPHTQPYRTRHL
jgi:two-component system sensor histidine kinase/response regulator